MIPKCRRKMISIRHIADVFLHAKPILFKTIPVKQFANSRTPALRRLRANKCPARQKCVVRFFSHSFIRIPFIFRWCCRRAVRNRTRTIRYWYASTIVYVTEIAKISSYDDVALTQTPTPPPLAVCRLRVRLSGSKCGAHDFQPVADTPPTARTMCRRLCEQCG